MNFESIKWSPFDYSDNKIDVYFEVADKQSSRKIMSNLSFIDNVQELEYGFEVKIAIQQIPEIVRELSRHNIAIYAVIPRK